MPTYVRLPCLYYSLSLPLVSCLYYYYYEWPMDLMVCFVVSYAVSYTYVFSSFEDFRGLLGVDIGSFED